MLLWASITFPHQECHNYDLLYNAKGDQNLQAVEVVGGSLVALHCIAVYIKRFPSVYGNCRVSLFSVTNLGLKTGGWQVSTKFDMG